MLRLTAKATQFGRRTFTSWLIESAGTVPIKRKKDYVAGNADNTESMEYLMKVSFKTYVSIMLIHPSTQALELGDAVCLFPEGMSRFHPTIAPLKTGGERQVASILCSSLSYLLVARLVSDLLSRNRDDPDFEISILTCSITYMYVPYLNFFPFC